MAKTNHTYHLPSLASEEEVGKEVYPIEQVLQYIGHHLAKLRKEAA